MGFGFMVGNRVQFISDKEVDSKTLTGKCGVIVDIVSDLIDETGDWNAVGIEFDELINGHSCRGKGREGYCWYVNASQISLIESKFEPATEEELLSFIGGD